MGGAIGGSALLPYPAQFCVFDSSRGQQEGSEGDKILFFFPPNLPLTQQVALVSLTEGLVAFSRIFSPHSPCSLMEAACNRHVTMRCEANIWMLLVVEKAAAGSEGNDVREEALRQYLREAYSLFRLFYGPISSLVNLPPSPLHATRCLAAFFPDFFQSTSSSFSTSTATSSSSSPRSSLPPLLLLPSLHYNLSPRPLLHHLPLDAEAALQAESLLNHITCSFPSSHALLLFFSFFVSSSLPPHPSASLFNYAIRRLIPSSLHTSSTPVAPHPPPKQSHNSHHHPSPSPSPSSSSTFSLSSLSRSLFKPTSSSPPPSLHSPSSHVTTNGPSSSSPHSHNNSSRTSSHAAASSSSSLPRPHSSSMMSALRLHCPHPPRPLAPNCWAKASDGFLATSAWTCSECTDGRQQVPTVFIRSWRRQGVGGNGSDVGEVGEVGEGEDRDGVQSGAEGMEREEARDERGRVEWMDKEQDVRSTHRERRRGEGGGGEEVVEGEEEGEGGHLTDVHELQKSNAKDVSVAMEPYRLHVFQHKGLTLLLLLPHHALPAAEERFRMEISRQLRPKIEALESAISRQWGGPLSCHVAGSRYATSLSNVMLAEASPSVKLSTLSKDSLLAIDYVRWDMDESTRRRRLQKRSDEATHGSTAADAEASGVGCVGGEERRTERGEEGRQEGKEDSRGKNSAVSADFSSEASLDNDASFEAWDGDEFNADDYEVSDEVMARHGSASWAVGRRKRGGEIYTVMEKAPETLLGVDAKVDQLAERFFNGRLQ